MKFFTLFIFFALYLFASNECVTCHKGIEDIRDKNSGMMKEIFKVAEKAGHKGNDCIVCHGGNPEAKTKEKAHAGTVEYFEFEKGPKEFYPAPGSSWINEHTCGMCHPQQVGAQMNSLMMTEQGKIQGAMWSFGGKEGYEHTAGTFDTKNPTNPDARLGTDIYKKYMQKLASMEPQVFPKANHELPNAPSVEEIHKDPSLAV
ncbi:MAG: cytochrome C, partial [Sulfurimonas sp.]